MYADGGSRGNPGPAGYGAVLFAGDGRTVLAERSAFLGRVTNNVAEYSGLIAGLEAAAELGARRVAVRMDSKLVVEQMSGRWQVKHPDMKPLARKASGLVRGFDRVSFEWVPRARNAHADRLANEAMDAGVGGAREAAVPEAGNDRTVEGGLFPEPGSTLPASGGALLTSAEQAAAVDPAAGPPVPNPTGATTVVVVRHGETTWGAVNRFAGREDVPLTERGRQEAEAVAFRLAPLRPFVVLTSPLRRCRDTAEVIAGAETVYDREGLLDGTLGEWTGFTAAQIEARWPAEFAAWRSNADAAPPGGESFNQIRSRVAAVMTQSIRDHPGRTVVLVTHAATTKMVLAEALDVPSSVAYRLRVDTASMSAFTVAPDGSTVVWAVNETGHLSL